MRYPPIAPFATGHLRVADGNEIYWETSGNPKGQPALYLHGGPGSGIMTGYRRYFDPEEFLIISFEQRGCGRSRPLVTEAGSDLATNTTQALISDMEELRRHFNVDQWLLVGMSWGNGRLDVSSPLQIAWNLHKAWPSSEFIVVASEGHGGLTMIDELANAVARVG